MDLATIQKYYDDYKLYYMVVRNNEGMFSPIVNLVAAWDDYGVIVSLRIGGSLPIITEFLINLGYDQTFIQNEIDKGYFSKETIPADANLLAILSDEAFKFNNIIAKYSKITPYRPRIIETLQNLPKNTIRPTFREIKTLRLTEAPSELVCSNALMEYTQISYLEYETMLIRYLMEQPPLFIVNVLANLGIGQINGTINVFYELAFFLNRFNAPIIHKDQDDILYISSLDIDQLMSFALLISKDAMTYGLKACPWGHACLLYIVLTGDLPPESYRIVNNSVNRYQALIPVEPYKIAALTWEFYGPRTRRDRFLPPYRYIAEKNPKPLEDIVLSASLQDVDQLINENGMVPPIQVQSPIDKFYYFAEAMKTYNNVYTRSLDLQPPGPLIGMRFKDAKALLSMYTDRELLDRYPITDIWENRSKLIYLIFENYRGATWRAPTTDCKNDNTFNIIEDELHGNINKKNKSDPTFAYGTFHDYSCYQTSELTASFHEDESGFHFTVPDWIDPILNVGRVGSELQEFPGKSMFQLLELIHLYIEAESARSEEEGKNANEILKPLIDKINLGLTKLNIVREELANNINVYESFPEPEKQWATIYLVWLFLFSMWMRFWKGPGHPYPFKLDQKNIVRVLLEMNILFSNYLFEI